MLFKIYFTFGLFLVIFGGALGDPLEECEVKKQRRCRHAVVEELDKKSKPLTTHELEFHCRRMRENLNCLILQVSLCPTPNRSGDLMLRAWKYMQTTCDTFEGWWNFECFHLEDMKKCEKIFALRDIAVPQASCREYDRFRHCTRDVVKKHCDPEDVHFAGTYLLDRAADMVWTCPPHGDPHQASPAVHEGFVGVDRKASGKAREARHPLSAVAPLLGVGATGRSAHGALQEVGVSSRGLQEVGVSSRGLLHEEGLGVVAEESRRVYSSAALTGDSPFVTGCNARATEEMRGCLDRHQYERDQALGARDSEDRLRKTCCATWNYRRCVQNAVRIHCYDTREIDVQSANDVIPHDRDFLCREHWIYTCNGSSHVSSGIALQAIAMILVLCLSYEKLLSF